MRAVINSPYVNPHWPTPQVERFVDAIFNGLDQPDSAELQKDQLYKKVFSDESPVFNKLEKLASQTLKLARRFVQFEALEKLRTEAFDQYLLGLFFLDKSMQEEYEHVHLKLQPWKETRSKWSHWEYCVNWLVEENFMRYQSEYFQKKDNRYLMHSISAIEDLYLSERNFYTSLLLSTNQMVPSFAENELAYLVNALQYPAQASYFSTAVSQLFKQVNTLLISTTTDLQTVTNFIALLREHGPDINPLHLNHLEVFAINYCVKRNGEDRRFLPLLYSLLKQRVESKRTFYEGRISASEFLSIVKTGLVCRDFEWVKAFMEENKDKITGSPNPEELYRYNLANYLFYTKQYDQALDILLRVGYDELQYKISAKVLEIKILYETESEVLPAKIDAAKIFFYREKSLSPQRKEQYCGFADFMRRLIRPQTAVNEDRIKKLKEELQAPPSIAERYWVEEKLDELWKKA